MPNELNPPEKPAPALKTDPELQAELQQERGARMALEAETARLSTMLGQVAAAPRRDPNAAPPVDPLDEFINGGVALQNDKAKRLLDAGIRGRIRGEVQGAVTAERQNTARAMWEQGHQVAFDMAMGANPDIAADPKGYAAATAATEYDARAANQNPSPSEFHRRSVTTYRTMFKKTPPAIDPLEAGGRGGTELDLKKKAEVPEPNVLEELYGFEPGEILPTAKAGAMSDLVDAYSGGKNEQLAKEGFRTIIPKIEGELITKRRKTAKAAAVAAAAR